MKKQLVAPGTDYRRLRLFRVLQTGQRPHALLLHVLDVIEHQQRIDVPSAELAGDVQVLAGAAPRRACDADDVARADGGALDGAYPREVAVADRVASVPQGHILAGGLVLPDLHDHALHHGQHLLSPRVQVDAVVELPFPRKGVFPIAVSRIDLYPAQGVAYAEIALDPFFPAGIGRRHSVAGGRRLLSGSRASEHKPRRAAVGRGGFHLAAHGRRHDRVELCVNGCRETGDARYPKQYFLSHAAKIASSPQAGAWPPSFLAKICSKSCFKYDNCNKIIL